VLNGGKAYVAVLMILSNSILVFVTFKTKALNSTCNWLMAANSACIALYSLTYFVQFGIVLLRPSGIPLWQCCLLIPVPLFFLCCQYILFPLIALDRLIGTIFPLKQMGSRKIGLLHDFGTGPGVFCDLQLGAEHQFCHSLFGTLGARQTALIFRFTRHAKF
uniref:G protein-coupled receptor n=1 Tax=Globodera pallida TaxID=36090 RepID=A0A183CMB1_GLOPA